MPLSKGKINPLGVLNLRKLSFIPEHFHSIYLNEQVDIKLVTQWIDFNLNCRYAIERSKSIDSSNKIISVIEIGLEDPKELTLFSIGCPYIHKQQREIF